jgi:hypothetical protein
MDAIGYENKGLAGCNIPWHRPLRRTLQGSVFCSAGTAICRNAAQTSSG